VNDPEPLVFEFVVDCGPDHAFDVWTARLDAWWPRDHRQSGEPSSRMELEGWVGGRLVERGPDGRIFQWGLVTRWEPPRSLSFDWHPTSGPDGPTAVELTFTRIGTPVDGPGGRPVDASAGVGPADRTAVRLVHTGWERFGLEAEGRRSRNQQGWEDLLPHYRRAADLCSPDSPIT